MPSLLKNILKYLASLGLAGLLLWYAFKGQNVETIWVALKQVNYLWLIPSFFVSILSHLSRAYRWNLLLEAINYKPKLSNSFMAVMIGYTANFFVPRMGEVSRCVVLQKQESIPLNHSFGTVVTERIFDMLVLLFLIFITFLFEIDKLGNFFSQMYGGKFDGLIQNKMLLLLITGVLVLVALIVVVILKKNWHRVKKISFYDKVSHFLKGLWEGIISVRRVKNKFAFFAHTVLIWGCYFLMPYLMFFSLPATENLSILAGLSVLTMGGIGMAIPVPGGVGSFHTIVAKCLVLYGISEVDGMTYAVLVHESQALCYLSVGIVCLVITLFMINKKKKIDKANQMVNEEV